MRETTTLRLIADLEEPTAGRILLDGADVSDMPPHKRNVNTVFQSYALSPFLSVFDNVAFGLKHSCQRPNCDSGQVMLRLAMGESLRSVVPNEDASSWSQGTLVHAYLPPDALRVLAGDAAPAVPAESPLAS